MTDPDTTPDAPSTAVSPAALAAQRPVRAHHHLGMIYDTPAGFRPLELDLFVPEGVTGAVPCVVWIHGGAWLFGSRALLPEAWPAASLFQRAIDAGLAVATIDYRHSREAPFPAQVHDGIAALRWLARYGAELGIAADRLALWGESAGGHLAALLALVSDAELRGDRGERVPVPAIRAAVSFYGVADVTTMPALRETMPREWFDDIAVALGGRWEEPLDILLAESPMSRVDADRLSSPVTHVRRNAPPFLLVHGEDDLLVSIEQSEQLASALTATGATVELVRVAGADHGFVGVDPLPLIDHAVAFLRSHLERG